MNNLEYLISAAGGNETAIMVIKNPKYRLWYEEQGERMREKYKPPFVKYKAEQAGFLILNQNHFEMAGGELCGNGTRAAAVALYKINGNTNLSYTVSGFKGNVKSILEVVSREKYIVKSVFNGMKTPVYDAELSGMNVKIVDLIGIVHVIINGDLPKDFEDKHHKISDKLKLDRWSAVGVVWYQEVGDGIKINPVVRVYGKIDPLTGIKSKDAFYYQRACGSGSIAVSAVTGETNIIQVTNDVIEVEITSNYVSLKSEMGLEVYHNDYSI
jgi:diaminopimelate epimerase